MRCSPASFAVVRIARSCTDAGDVCARDRAPLCLPWPWSALPHHPFGRRGPHPLALTTHSASASLHQLESRPAAHRQAAHQPHATHSALLCLRRRSARAHPVIHRRRRRRAGACFAGDATCELSSVRTVPLKSDPSEQSAGTMEGRAQPPSADADLRTAQKRGMGIAASARLTISWIRRSMQCVADVSAFAACS